MDGREIRAAREQRGLTQQQLADAIGVGHRTIGSWERGETVPQNRMGMLRKFFGVDGVDDPIRAAPDTVLLAELMRRAASREQHRPRPDSDISRDAPRLSVVEPKDGLEMEDPHDYDEKAADLVRPGEPIGRTEEP